MSPNVYQTTIVKMNPKIKAWVDYYDNLGQMDHDDYGDPYITEATRLPAGYRIVFSRKNTIENAVISTRKPDENGLPSIIKITSDFSDGWKRAGSKKMNLAPEVEDGRRVERAKRLISDGDFASAMEQLI